METTACRAGKREANKNSLEEKFVARQKRRLEETRKVLLQEIFDLDEGERVWNEERRGAPDFESHASARELDFILEDKLGHRLTFVERALEKIEEGKYGLCDATGKPIPQGRLEAIPEAIYTLETVKDSGVNTRLSSQRRGQKAQGISR